MLTKTRAVLTLTTLITLSLAASPAWARTECNQEARVCFDVPDDWVTTAQNGMIMVRPANGGVALEIRGVTEAAQLEQDRRLFERELASRCHALEWDTEPTAVQQHGMSGVVRRGHGAYENGEEMRFFMVALAHTTGGIAALGVLTRRNLQANWPVLEAILNSIRPA